MSRGITKCTVFEHECMSAKLQQQDCGEESILFGRTAGNQDIDEGHARILGQVLVVDHLLQQRLLQRLPGAAPQFVLPTVLSDHHSTQRVLRRRPG